MENIVTAECKGNVVNIWAGEGQVTAWKHERPKTKVHQGRGGPPSNPGPLPPSVGEPLPSPEYPSIDIYLYT